MKYTRELFDESLITETWENVHGYVDQLEARMLQLEFDSSFELAAAKDREKEAFRWVCEFISLSSESWESVWARYEKSKEGK